MQNVNMYLSGYQDKFCQNMYIAKGQCPFFSKLFAICLRSAFLKKTFIKINIYCMHIKHTHILLVKHCILED